MIKALWHNDVNRSIRHQNYRSKACKQTSPKQYLYQTQLVSKRHHQRLHALFSVHATCTVMGCLLLIVMQSQELLPPNQCQPLGASKACTGPTVAAKVGPSQPDYPYNSHSFCFPCSFLETQLPHIVTMFSAHQSLAIDQLKGHLVRFARNCMVDQKVPVSRLPTP